MNKFGTAIRIVGEPIVRLCIAVSTPFVDVQSIKSKMLQNNENIHWVPGHIQHGRFGKILENAPDWAISKSLLGRTHSCVEM